LLLSHHFSKSISSTLTVSLFRKKAIKIPNPTAPSAAASVITKLDGHKHDHHIAASQYADHAQNEESGGNYEIVKRRYGRHCQRP
jgi:hypothetical protein